MNLVILVYLIIPLLLIFSGCKRYIEWAHTTIPQGTFSPVLMQPPPGHIVAAYVYDQFATLGLFDVMWLGPQIRERYALLYAYKYQLTPALLDEFKRRQIEETRQHISFYLLVGGQAGEGLEKEAQNWSIRLLIDGVAYAPVHLAPVELPLEYRCLFGRRFTRFRIPYQAKFDAHDVHGKQLITNDTKKLVMVLRCVSKEVTLEWDLEAIRLKQVPQKREFKQMLAYDVWPDPV